MTNSEPQPSWGGDLVHCPICRSSRSGPAPPTRDEPRTAEPRWPAVLALLATGRLAFRHSRAASLRTGMAAAGGCYGAADTDRGGASRLANMLLNRVLSHIVLSAVTASMVWSLGLLIRPPAAASRPSAGVAASRRGVVGGQHSGVRLLVLASGCRRPECSATCGMRTMKARSCFLK